MFAKISSAVICAAIFTVAACDFGPPQVQPPEQESQSAAAALPPATSLTPAQVYGVLECQQTIQYQGAEFTSLKESALNECLDGTLKVQLGFENGLINSMFYNHEMSQVRSDCALQFKEIGAASTRLVNSIIGACGPVQNLILPNSGYDPLQFGALTRAQGVDLISDATGLAGRICGAKELFVDALVDIQVPRMAGLLKILDNGTGQFATSGPSSSLFPVSTIPNIPLDTRCIFPALP
ncbi:MAG TPA: hypothetical protein VHY56_00580 [Candidatus Binataceae bacterium]|nr:hypothetical protein [Candidatus Binataceae bacterium]